MITTKTRNMENRSRIEELLSEALKKYDQMLEKHDETNARLEKIENRLGNIEYRVNSVETEIQKLNLQTSSNTRALMYLADQFPLVFDHEKRITRLEGSSHK